MRVPSAAVEAAKQEWARRYGNRPWPLALRTTASFGRGGGVEPSAIAEAEALVDAAVFPTAWDLLGHSSEFDAVDPSGPVVQARSALVTAVFGQALLAEPWKLDWAAWRSFPPSPTEPWDLSDNQAAMLVDAIAQHARLPAPTNTFDDVSALNLPLTVSGGGPGGVGALAPRIFTQIQLGAWGQTFRGPHWGNINGVAELLRGYFGPMSYRTWLSNTINTRNMLREFPGWTKAMEREWTRVIGEMAREYRQRFEGFELP